VLGHFCNSNVIFPVIFSRFTSFLSFTEFSSSYSSFLNNYIIMVKYEMKYYWIASTIEIKMPVLACREINTNYVIFADFKSF
jgi:hypothetical protein